jgi:hypothetical protein
VVVAAADRGRSSLLVDVEAGVEVEASFADANLPFLRRMRNERLGRP